MFSHRIRLTLISAAVSGLVLALVFVGVSMLFERTEVQTSRRVLKSALIQLSRDMRIQGSRLSLTEIHEEHPGLTFAIFGPTGNLMQKIGVLPVKPHLDYNLSLDPSQKIASDGAQYKDYLLLAEMDWTEAAGRLHSLRLTLFWLWFFVVALAASVSWFAATATFRPLNELTLQAALFSGKDLSRRLDSGDKAEFGQFTKQLNSLLDRIEDTTKREEQFASDAAHELRTPLAILRGKVEAVLMKKRTEAEYQQTLNSLLPEVDRLTRLVDMLLRSARGTQEAPPVTELSEYVHQAASRWLDKFENQHVHLTVKAESAYAAIWPEELECIVDNFLNNALKASPPGSSCEARLEVEDSHAILRVTDQGSGIPDGLIAQIFERFTRAENSRNRASGGFGIGLAVCKNIVTARGGTISARNLSPGAEFKVEFANSGK